jgi:hypothetical protein
MTPEQEERLVGAFEKIAAIMEKRYEYECPIVAEAEEGSAEIFVRGEGAPEPATKEEYGALEERPGRFQNLIKTARRETSG